MATQWVISKGTGVQLESGADFATFTPKAPWVILSICSTVAGRLSLMWGGVACELNLGEDLNANVLHVFSFPVIEDRVYSLRFSANASVRWSMVQYGER